MTELVSKDPFLFVRGDCVIMVEYDYWMVVTTIGVPVFATVSVIVGMLIVFFALKISYRLVQHNLIQMLTDLKEKCGGRIVR
jgi:hypothetical protein